MRFPAAFFLGLVLFFCGCLSDVDHQSLLFACQRASDPAFGDFPSCDSVATCISKAHEQAVVDLALFPREIQSRYRDYETHLGSAWYHANRLKKTLAGLKSQCASLDSAGLFASVNQLEYHSMQAVQSSDAAYAAASDLVALEYTFLDRMRVQSMADEELLSDWTTLNANRRDFETSNENPDTFAGALWATARDTKAFFARQGVFLPPLATRTWKDDLVRLAEQPPDHLKRFHPLAPVIAESLASLLSDWHHTRSLENGFSRLSAEPLQGLRLLENWISPNQFLTRRFWELERSLSNHARTWNERMQTLDESIASNADKTQLLFDELERAIGSSLDENTWARLSARAPSTRVAEGTNLFNDWPSFHQGMAEELRALRLERARLTGTDNRIAWGEKDTRMRALDERAARLHANALQLKTTLLAEHDNLCAENARAIEKRLASEPLSAADALAKSIQSRIRLFDAARAPADRFYHCANFLAFYDEWLGIRTKRPEDALARFARCGRSVRDLFETPHSFSAELAPFLPRFERMAALPADHPIDDALAACLELEHDALSAASQTPAALDALENIRALFALKNDAWRLDNEKLLENVSAEIERTKTYHDNQRTLSLAGILAFDEWPGPLREKISKFRAAHADAVEQYLARHAAWRAAPNAVLDLNRVTDFEAIVDLPNSLGRELDGPYLFEVHAPFDVATPPDLPNGVFIAPEQNGVSFAIEKLPASGLSIGLPARLQLPTTDRVSTEFIAPNQIRVLERQSFSLPLDAIVGLGPAEPSVERWINDRPLDANETAVFLRKSSLHVFEREQILVDPVSCSFAFVERAAITGRSRLDYDFECRNRSSIDLSPALAPGPFLIEAENRDRLVVRTETNAPLSTRFYANEWWIVIPSLPHISRIRGRIEMETENENASFAMQKNALAAQLLDAQTRAFPAEQTAIQSILYSLNALPQTPNSNDWTTLAKLQTRSNALLETIRTNAERANARETHRTLYASRIQSLETLFDSIAADAGAEKALFALEAAKRALASCENQPDSATADCTADLGQKTTTAAREIRKLLDARANAAQKRMTDCNATLRREFQDALAMAWNAFNNGPQTDTPALFAQTLRLAQIPCAPTNAADKTTGKPANSDTAKQTIAKHISRLRTELDSIPADQRANVFRELGLDPNLVDEWQRRLDDARSTDDLQLLERDINRANNLLQTTAIEKFNEGVRTLNALDEPPASAIAEFENAKQAIAAKKFAIALAALSRATPQLENAPATPIPLLYLAPVLAAIALLAAVRYHQKTVIAPKTREIQRIKDDW